jgi:site-specific recombinase XerD
VQWARACSGTLRAVKGTAAAAGITAHHALRHCFAAHLLEAGQAMQTVQELLGYADAKTTMICAHELNRGRLAAMSPLDMP